MLKGVIIKLKQVDTLCNKQIKINLKDETIIQFLQTVVVQHQMKIHVHPSKHTNVYGSKMMPKQWLNLRMFPV